MRRTLCCLLVFAIMGCTTTIPSLPTAMPASTQAIRSDVELALDAALTEWLKSKSEQAKPKFAVLLAANVPDGYRPMVQGWTIVRTDESDPCQPPRTVREGDTQYQLLFQSSYARPEKIEPSANARQEAATRAVEVVQIDDPIFLHIDSLRISADSGRIVVSQNHHHNMGMSGAAYEMVREDGRWICSPRFMENFGS